MLIRASLLVVTLGFQAPEVSLESGIGIMYAGLGWAIINSFFL